MSAEAIVSSIIVAVISGLILESIREHRKSGKQTLEKCYDYVRTIISWILQRLAKD
jgi:hypothetical protein